MGGGVGAGQIAGGQSWGTSAKGKDKRRSSPTTFFPMAVMEEMILRGLCNN